MLSRLLSSNLYAHLRHSRSRILHSIKPPSPPTSHFASIPSKPSRENRTRERLHPSENDFLRTLNFRDDINHQTPERSHQTPLPNRPLRGEKRPDRPEERSRDRPTPSSRPTNRPTRGAPRNDRFQAPPPTAPPQFSDQPSSTVSDTWENPIKGDQFGDSLLRNLKFGEVGRGEEAGKPDPSAEGSDPAVSDSSMKDADEIFKKMKETGLIPNAVAMLDGLCKDGLIQEAMKLFGSMREKGSIPEVVVYTAVVEGFCKAEKFEDAERVFRKMQKNVIEPNAFSYGVVIRGLCKGGKLEDAVEFSREMLDAGHSPNVATFVGLVEGFCTEKGVEEARGAIRSLQERGFAVDEKAVREHLDKKGPFSPMVNEAIFEKKSSETDHL